MVLAGFDPLRMPEVWARTPVRLGLELYIRKVLEEEVIQFRHDQHLFVQGGLKKKPQLGPMMKAAELREKKRKRQRQREFRAPEKPGWIGALERMGEQDGSGSS